MNNDLKITPSTDFILIQPEIPATKTTSGILIGKEDWNSTPPIGEVIAVGPDVKAVKQGQNVVYLRFSAVSISANVKDKEYPPQLVREKHVIGLVE